MAVIKVPKTPRSSFDKNRRPSKLLLDQIAHLEWAALPAWQRTPKRLQKYAKARVRTEQQAAERIGQLTEMIVRANDDAAQEEASGVRPTVRLPPAPGRVPRKKARSSRKTKAATSRARRRR